MYLSNSIAKLGLWSVHRCNKSHCHCSSLLSKIIGMLETMLLMLWLLLLMLVMKQGCQGTSVKLVKSIKGKARNTSLKW
jgi:hypothetical protein